MKLIKKLSVGTANVIKSKARGRKPVVFSGLYECEFCSTKHIHAFGRDNKYFMKKVIPSMRCLNCGERTTCDYLIDKSVDVDLIEVGMRVVIPGQQEDLAIKRKQKTNIYNKVKEVSVGKKKKLVSILANISSSLRILEELVREVTVNGDKENLINGNESFQ